jgi:hypothetical protein
MSWEKTVVPVFMRDLLPPQRRSIAAKVPVQIQIDKNHFLEILFYIKLVARLPQ